MLVFNLVLFGAFATAFATPNDTEHRNSCPSGFFKTSEFCMGLWNDQCEYYGGVSYQGFCVIQKPILPLSLDNKITPEGIVLVEDYSAEFRRLNYSENLHLKSRCGVANYMTERVFNGLIASPDQLPWMLKFELQKRQCSAVLISQRHVLTARHCVTKSKSNNVDVKKIIIKHGGICAKTGLNCPNGSDMKSVKVRHVGFSDCIDDLCKDIPDIALLELENDIPLDDSTNPICIGNFSLSSMLNVQASGYGMTQNNRISSDILRYMHAEIIANNPRNQILVRGLKSTNNSEVNADMCRGDSGGALQGISKYDDRAYLLGILSHGWGKCTKPDKTGFVSVPFFFNWIRQYTNIL